MGLFHIFGKKSKKRISESAQQIAKTLTLWGMDMDAACVQQMIDRENENYKKKGILYFGSDFESVAKNVAAEPLPEPFEGYAKEIVEIFKSFKDSSGWMSENEPKLTKIGQKMNDNQKQLLVAHRAKRLCFDGYSKGNTALGNFDVRYLEYAWDGIGGWIS